MLETAQYFINQAGQKLGLNKTQIDQLLQTDAEHQFEIKLGGKNLKAYRVQHNNRRGPYKGGIRFHQDVDLNEVRALATLMSMKTAALGLPLGGGKGGVVIDPKKLSLAELEEISRQYVRGLHQHIGPDKDVPAPDVNTDAQIIDWMVDEYEILSGDTTKASFTGKSLANGGSLGREAATGRGGVFALAELLSHDQYKLDENITYAVQGFGNVGSFFALVGSELHPNWRLVAASDSAAGLVNDSGLNSQDLADFKQGGGSFSERNEPKLTNDQLLGKDVDVLVLAALGDAVTEENMHLIRAKYIVEMANGPLSAKAYQHLSNQGVRILPDIIANSGGVVVSYLEWVQNKTNVHWSEDKVNDQLNQYIQKAMQRVLALADQEKINLTLAAFMVAIEELIAA